MIFFIDLIASEFSAVWAHWKVFQWPSVNKSYLNTIHQDQHQDILTSTLKWIPQALI